MKKWSIFTIFGISVFAALLMIGLVANQVMAATPEPKVTICHKDPGDPDTTIIVGGKKLAAKHISQHGDHLGACNVCGDGFIDDNETCDDNNTANGDGCSSTCQIQAYCGDGSVDAGEQCDDANATNGDGCENDCTFTPAPVCGDGNVDAGEECDDGGTVSGNGCSATCTVEFCGDGITQTGIGEECDGSDLNGQTCEDYPNKTGDLSCDFACEWDTTTCDDVAVCGDGNVDAGEECDDGGTVSGDGCSSTCFVEAD